MLIPIRTDSPLRTTPYMNWALILANVLMFVAQNLGPRTLSPYGPRWFDPLQLYPTNPHLYAFISYAFLHGGLMHLLSNMLFLYIFGNNVNDKMGHIGFLAYYLAGGVVSGIAYVLWDPSGVPIVGASGAISAVTGAYLILFPRSNITIFYFFIIMGWTELGCVWFIVAFFVMDLINLSGQSSVAHIAHIGGTIFGCAVSYILLWAHLLPRDQFDVVALVRQWNRRRQYRDAVAGGWNPYVNPAPAGGPPGFGGGPPADATPDDPRAQRAAELRAEISEAIAHHKLPEAAALYLELKKVDPQQVLSRQAQLDVANQLANQQLYPPAAEAYEMFLRNYPKFEQIEQVQLMLGIIYARYMNMFDRARELLLLATARLHAEGELKLARAELARLSHLTQTGGSRPQ